MLMDSGYRLDVRELLSCADIALRRYGTVMFVRGFYGIDIANARKRRFRNQVRNFGESRSNRISKEINTRYGKCLHLNGE